MDRFEEGIVIMKRVVYSIVFEVLDELKGYYYLVMGNNYKGVKCFEEVLYYYKICVVIVLKNNFNIDLIYINIFMVDIYQE